MVALYSTGALGTPHQTLLQLEPENPVQIILEDGRSKQVAACDRADQLCSGRLCLPAHPAPEEEAPSQVQEAHTSRLKLHADSSPGAGC